MSATIRPKKIGKKIADERDLVGLGIRGEPIRRVKNSNDLAQNGLAKEMGASSISCDVVETR